MRYTYQDLTNLHTILTRINAEKDFETGLCLQLIRYNRPRLTPGWKNEKLFELLASHLIGTYIVGSEFWMLPLTPEGDFQKPEKWQESEILAADYYYHHPKQLVSARQKLVHEMLIEIEKRLHDGLQTPDT